MYVVFLNTSEQDNKEEGFLLLHEPVKLQLLKLI